mgnify:CR=1 FL=1
MTIKSPDYTIANNPYANVLCGPFGPEGKDTIKSEFTIACKSGSQQIFYEGGDKLEVVKGSSHEICGTDEGQVDTDSPNWSDQKVGKSITAENGSICFLAENGDLHIKARNIYLEANAGESDQGNIFITAKGHTIIKSGEELRLGGSRMCVICPGNMNFVGNMIVNGGFDKASSVASAQFLSAVLAGNWATLISQISKSCK